MSEIFISLLLPMKTHNCREDSSMPIPFKSDPTKFNQRLLFPTNVFDLLPKEHA